MVNVFLLRCIPKKNRADIHRRDQAVSHTTPIFLSILRPEGVMDAGRVEMAAWPFIGATAVDAVGSTGSSDMKPSRGIELATFSPSERSTVAAAIRIFRPHMVSIRAVSAALSVVSGTAENAGGVGHRKGLFLTKKEF
jgi:hypothetical protein